MMKALVLLSSGLDSSINLAKSIHDGFDTSALTFDYGQKASRQELTKSKQLCDHYKIPHTMIELPWFKDITRSALIHANEKLPELSTENLDDEMTTQQSAKRVWVPNRNGVFLNIAASYAESKSIDKIIVGFNAEEAKTFPDNSEEYMFRINKALEYSTLTDVVVMSFTTLMNKIQIVKMGKELKVPFDFIWSCYEGGLQQCGRCESCKRYLRAIETP